MGSHKTPTFAQNFTKNFIKMKHKNDLLEAILANQTAIANAFGINLPFPSSTIIPAVDPLEYLPAELVLMLDSLENQQAFIKAFTGDKPLLFFRNGKIVTSIKKKNLYGYLLGRLFCGDYPKQLGPVTIWKSGKANFPDSALFRAFDLGNVRQSRQNQLNQVVPIGHELIDILFVV